MCVNLPISFRRVNGSTKARTAEIIAVDSRSCLRYRLRTLRARDNSIIAFVYETLIRHENTTARYVLMSFMCTCIKILHTHAIEGYSWTCVIVLATFQVSLKFLERKIYFLVGIYKFLFIHIRNWKCALFQKFSLTKFKVVEIFYLHTIQNALNLLTRFFRFRKFKILNLLQDSKYLFIYLLKVLYL